MRKSNTMLYYLPGVNGIPADRGVIREAGLGAVIGDAALTHRQCVGPDGSNGIIVAADGEGAVSMDKGAQTWQQANGGKFWVGYWTERKPGPRDLQRSEVVDGHFVRLADDNDWLIPVVRLIDGDTRLPQVIGFDADGTVRLSVTQKYAQFYEHGFAIFNELVERDRYAESAEQLLSVAIEALTVNYRVGKWEAGALGLITTNNLVAIARAIIDYPAIEAQQSQKKTQFATPDSSHGPEG